MISRCYRNRTELVLSYKLRASWSRIKPLTFLGLAATALASAAVFDTDLTWWGWLSAVVNLAAVVLVPSHIRPDEKIQAEAAPMPLPTTSGKKSRSGGAVKIDLPGDDGEDREALLGEPSDEDLEVGRINERRHLAKAS